MKNLITSIACVVILLVFVLQFASNQITHNHLTTVDKSVNAFKEVAKQEGYISDENSSELKDEIARTLCCNRDKISISGTDIKVIRGKKIHYIVEMPLENIIIGAEFLNISKDESEGKYIIDNYTTSEYLDRS